MGFNDSSSPLLKAILLRGLTGLFLIALCFQIGCVRSAEIQVVSDHGYILTRRLLSSSTTTLQSLPIQPSEVIESEDSVTLKYRDLEYGRYVVSSQSDAGGVSRYPEYGSRIVRLTEEQLFVKVIMNDEDIKPIYLDLTEWKVSHRPAKYIRVIKDGDPFFFIDFLHSRAVKEQIVANPGSYKLRVYQESDGPMKYISSLQFDLKPDYQVVLKGNIDEQLKQFRKEDFHYDYGDDEDDQ